MECLMREISYSIISACLVAIVLLACCGCGEDKGAAVNVVGSTSVQPFAEYLAQEYGKQGFQVEVQGGGSTAGLQAVTNGLADIGMCSRALKGEEAEKYQGIVIARDGLAIVVNPANPIKDLTLAQLREIFSGKARNWKEFGGLDGPIRPISREEGSGTRESFVKLVMGKERIARAAITQESNGAVKELVKGDRAAIGYMSLGLVGTEVKTITVDGAKPTHEDVISGTYKLTRPFLFVLKGQASPEAQKFIDYVLSETGQKLLESEGLVRAK